MRREEEYWKERAEENARRVFRYSQRRAELVTRWFKRAEREMREKILAFYRRYAEQERITLQQAKAALNDPRAQRLTLEEAQRLAEQYPEDPVVQKLLQTDYLRRAISREELLIQQLNLLASELYGEYAQELHKSLSEVFEEGYYRTIYDQQQYTGFGQNFDTLNTNQIEAAVTTAWQGKNYSERLWGDHRVSLARYLNRIVTTGMIQGSSGAQMTAQLQKAMGTGAYEARRLIRTECCQVSSRAAVLGYRQCGTEQYQFLATLDYQTSEICRELDGQVFEVSEAVPGKNMPPMHPFCRSTTVPHRPDREFDKGTTRAARNGKGETYRVPADMTYRQWYDQYVKPDPEELLAEKMVQNGGQDAKQWEQYTSLLGRDAPESLDKFQRIKYTDPVKWEFMQLDYRRRNRLRKNPDLKLPGAKQATAVDQKFTHYLFNPESAKGWSKGAAIISRLGYTKDNWEELRSEILRKAPLYPATPKQKDQYGQKYEQKIVVDGLLGTPANMIIGWNKDNDGLRMITAYIAKVDD